MIKFLFLVAMIVQVKAIPSETVIVPLMSDPALMKSVSVFFSFYMLVSQVQPKMCLLNF